MTRQRWRHAVAAVLVAAMVVLALPVSATHQDAVASQHTTDADFNAATTLTNTTVQGTGTAAAVRLAKEYFSGFDDGTFQGWEPEGEDQAVVAVTTTNPYNGSHSVEVSESDPGNSGVGWIYSPTSHDDNWHLDFRFRDETSGDEEHRLFVNFWNNSTSDGYQVEYGNAGGTNNPTLTISAPDGTTIASKSVEYPQGEWIRVNVTVNGTDFSFESRNSTGAELHNLSATLGGTGDGTFDIGRQTGTSQTGDAFFDDISITDYEPASGQYVSQNHTVDNATTLWANLTLQGASATVEAQYWDGSSWQVAASTTETTTGNYTLDVSATTASKWRTNVTITSTGEDPVAELHDEGLLFSPRAPTVSLASPGDSTVVNSDTPTLKAQVNDSDFALAQGDSVDADFEVKEPGETGFDVEGTKTVTSNGTTSFDYTAADGGDYEWRVNVSDSYGHTNTSGTRTFTVPDEITFRNESNASQTIAGVNVTATFYSADGTTVIQKTDSDNDGMISLAGLPTTKEFVVTVDAPGWYERRVYIESIFTQQDVYLLNTTAHPNAVDTTFVYEDRTGDFPQESTTLRVQRALDKNNDGTFNWTTVAGDFWGAAGEFPFTGEPQVRYRLVVENEDGEQRVLGTHIPRADGTKNIVIGRITWDAENATGRTFDADLSVANQEIVIQYLDPEDSTTSVRLRVWELGNTSNEIHNQTYSSGPYGKLAVNVSLTANQTETSWVVNMTGTHSSDGEITNQLTVGGGSFSVPVDPWLLGTFVYVLVTFVAFLYGPRTAHIGAWTIFALVGIIALFQLVAIPTSAIIASGAVAAGGTFYREGVP